MEKLSATERDNLLQIARLSVRRAAGVQPDFYRLLREIRLTDPLLEPRGAFVSLKKLEAAVGQSRLRGCIGRIESEKALYDTVIEMAAAAASRDPRFPPVAAAELPELRVEVSALQPLQPIPGPEAIVVGRDGVQLRKGTASAVFLPQVAPEQGWDTRQLLQHLARKAGLPADGWEGARLSTFQADVFGEEGGAGRPDC